MKLAVIGASGFIGSEVVARAELSGHEVVALTAPRLRARSTSAQLLADEAVERAPDFATALAAMRGADAVINAAGLSRPTTSDVRDLVGANALMPAVLARTIGILDIPRLVHISSAAVYGRRALVEGALEQPETPYAESKLLGDQLTRALTPPDHTSVLYRPTSVHGLSRKLTRTLASFARSPMSSVAGTGEAHTPQVLAPNVAQVAVFLSTTDTPPTKPVLHPSEGMTTRRLLHGLSGKDPKSVPEGLARLLINDQTARLRLPTRLRANLRRLELLWFGQKQEPGWLASKHVIMPASWDDFFTAVRQHTKE